MMSVGAGIIIGREETVIDASRQCNSGVDVKSDGATDGQGGRSIAVADEDIAMRKGSRSKAKDNEPNSAAEPRTVVVVGLLQLSSGASLRGMTFIELSRALKAVRLPDRDRTTVDLWLDSPGGSARDAYKIALLLRSVASHIRVVIPDYAKSAATLLSLVADEIYMGPAAELGPIDVQLDYEKSPGITVSALDRVGNLNEITEAARDIVLGLGGEVRSATRLGRGETVAVMAELASSLLKPLVEQVDPTILHQSVRMLREAAGYGMRLLLTREDCPRELVATLPDRLTTAYPTHGYAISLDEASELGLPVKPIEEYEFCEQVLACYQENQESRTNVVEVLNVIEADAPAKTKERKSA